MSATRDIPEQLAFFASPPHACGYLPERMAVSVFVDPNAVMDMHVYSRLADYGFRRSGSHVYTPKCPHCRACVPARIPVRQFRPNRAQRRCLRANARVSATPMAVALREEQFALYRRYISSRHPGGGMDDPNPDKYLEFLGSDWSDTLFVEFRQQDHLLAVSVLDVLDQGLSAVYTFFDPDFEAQSPGRFTLLWAIEETRRRGLDWLYLGFWIGASQKMRYKQEYRPLELLLDGQWQGFHADQQLPTL